MARPRLPRDEATERFYVGLRPQTIETLRHFAARHGRDPEHVQDEVRAALDLYIAESMLDSLDDPEFIREIAEHRPDFDESDFRAQTERDAQEARDLAFGRKRRPTSEQIAPVLSKRRR